MADAIETAAKILKDGGMKINVAGVSDTFDGDIAEMERKLMEDD